MKTLKTKIKYLFFSIPLILLGFNGHAVQTIEVLQVSTSGRTLILARGELGGIKNGIKAKLLLQKGTMDRPKLTPFAFGEVIKSTETISYWHLDNIDQKNLIRKGQQIVYITVDEVLSGRRQQSIKHKKVILKNGTSLLEIRKQEKRGLPSYLVKEKEFKEGKKLVKKGAGEAHDIETTNYDFWKENKHAEKLSEYTERLDSKFIDRPYSVVSSQKIKDEDDRRIFDSTVKGVVSKVNNLKYGLSGLYREQERSEEVPEIKKRLVINNTYDKYLSKQEKLNLVDEKFVRKVKREGTLWSADLSDSELRETLINSGIALEKRKQALALKEKDGNEIYVRFRQSLNKNTTGLDENHRNHNYGLSLGYEFHLKRTSLLLKNWGLEVEYSNALSNFDVGGVNARFEESSIAIAFNYYIYNGPSSLDSYIWYLNTGIRRGNANVQGENLTRDYNYILFGLPSLSLGMKYRFKSGDGRNDDIKVGLGVNFLIGYEVINISATDSLVDDIEAEKTFGDLKLGVGLSVYF